MFEVLTKWYRRYLFDEESILLLIMLILGLVLLNYVGDILAPLLVSIVLAYLMQGVANTLRDKGLANWLAVTFAFVLFMGGFLGSTLLLLPLVWRQLSSLVRELPGMLDRARDFLNVLPIEYPTMVNTEQLNSVIDLARVEIAQFGQIVITKSLAGLPGLLTLAIYLILIPILVFFLLKDRDEMIQFNKYHLTIVVPKVGFRAINYNPDKALDYGCQIVAMHFQRIDDFLREYLSHFSEKSFRVKPFEFTRFHDTIQKGYDQSKIAYYDTYKKEDNNIGLNRQEKTTNQYILGKFSAVLNNIMKLFSYRIRIF